MFSDIFRFLKIFLFIVVHKKLSLQSERSTLLGERWDVRLDFVRQFKSELVRRLECLVFDKKKYINQLG